MSRRNPTKYGRSAEPFMVPDTTKARFAPERRIIPRISPPARKHCRQYPSTASAAPVPQNVKNGTARSQRRKRITTRVLKLRFDSRQSVQFRVPEFLRGHAAGRSGTSRYGRAGKTCTRREQVRRRTRTDALVSQSETGKIN